MANISVKGDIRDYKKLHSLLLVIWALYALFIPISNESLMDVKVFNVILFTWIAGLLMHAITYTKIASLIFGGISSLSIAYAFLKPDLYSIGFACITFVSSIYSAGRFASDYELPMPEIRNIYLRQLFINMFVIGGVVGVRYLVFTFKPGS